MGNFKQRRIHFKAVFGSCIAVLAFHWHVTGAIAFAQDPFTSEDLTTHMADEVETRALQLLIGLGALQDTSDVLTEIPADLELKYASIRVVAAFPPVAGTVAVISKHGLTGLSELVMAVARSGAWAKLDASMARSSAHLSPALRLLAFQNRSVFVWLSESMRFLRANSVAASAVSTGVSSALLAAGVVSASSTVALSPLQSALKLEEARKILGYDAVVEARLDSALKKLGTVLSMDAPGLAQLKARLKDVLIQRAMEDPRGEGPAAAPIDLLELVQQTRNSSGEGVIPDAVLNSALRLRSGLETLLQETAPQTTDVLTKNHALELSRLDAALNLLALNTAALDLIGLRSDDESAQKWVQNGLRTLAQVREAFKN